MHYGEEQGGYRQASGNGSSPGLHAPSHAAAGADPVALSADQITSGTFVMARIHPYARMLSVESYLSGVLPGVTATYAAPGTTAGGVGAPARLINLKVAGLSTPSTWILQGIYGGLDTAPGMGNTLQVTLWKKSTGGSWGATTATFTIAGTAVTGSDEAHNLSFTNDDQLGFRVDGAGSAADLHLTLLLLRTA